MQNKTLKIISMLTIILITLIMSIVSASAASELTIKSDMQLGGSDSDRNEDLTYTVTIENTGDENLTGLSVTFDEK